ncbi:MAG TPA: hypothetical protein VGV59_13680 [Pyrinomonadaceae bacterium]|nr:hypothetical protein [Pyrinomonadaceae bacterium]
MPQQNAQPFGAQPACPSPDKLLAYTEDALSFIAREHVRSHLVSCDFCGAATQLLSQHRPSAETPLTPPSETRVPAHILLLARHLLPRARHDGHRLGRHVA